MNTAVQPVVPAAAAVGTVLVVGATGALGRPAVRRLRERGVAVRALSRHPEQAADLVELGAEAVAGDLVDAPSLRRACAGATRVLAAAHSIMGRGRWRSEAVDDRGHRDLIAAARAAGVKRFVYVSAFGAGPRHAVDFFRTKYAVEQALADSGLDAVVLRPTAYMEHHVHAFNGRTVLAKGRAQLVGPGTKPRNFICAADVAEFAVRALLEDPPPFREIALGGHDHLGNADVAALYARSAGIAPQASHLPPALVRSLATLVRPFHPGLARIMALLSLPDDAIDERFEGAAALEANYGIRLTRIDDFVRRQVQAHRAR